MFLEIGLIVCGGKFTMIIDWANYKIISKIVYYGPAMSGKTTTVKALLKKFGCDSDLQSIETTSGRTLFFDFGNLTFKNGDWTIIANLWTATGQDYYYSTRESVLLGVDGVIFVADATPDRRKHNISSWNELLFLLGKQFLTEIPVIIALNKVDLSNALSEDELLKQLNLNSSGIEVFSTVAKDGTNVDAPLRCLLKKIFSKRK